MQFLIKKDYKEFNYFLNTKSFKKIFILSGINSYKKSGALNLFEEIFKKKKTYFFFKKNFFPEINELEKIIKSIRTYKPDLIIAIGGGSVIDYAKIANIKDIEFNLKFNIKNNIHSNKKFTKLVAIPTSAGSGAEVTSNAVMYIKDKKFSLEGDKIKPNNFFLIPDLILNNRKILKASSGFDAISQAIESMISVKSNKQSLIFAKKSLEFSLSNYLSFFSKPNFKNAEMMSLAAMYAGKAIDIAKTTAPHAVSYPFTALYGISHGHAVSLTLEKFLKFNFFNIDKSICNFDLKKRYHSLFKIFKVKNIYELEKKIKNLKHRTRLYDNFKDLNIDINNNYHKILDGVNLQRLKNNPVKLQRKDLKFLLLNN